MTVLPAKVNGALVAAAVEVAVLEVGAAEGDAVAAGLVVGAAVGLAPGPHASISSNKQVTVSSTRNARLFIES